MFFKGQTRSRPGLLRCELRVWSTGDVDKAQVLVAGSGLPSRLATEQLAF